MGGVCKRVLVCVYLGVERVEADVAEGEVVARDVHEGKRGADGREGRPRGAERRGEEDAQARPCIHNAM